MADPLRANRLLHGPAGNIALLCHTQSHVTDNLAIFPGSLE